eukprot:TRINITY_DN12973_c0_g1_i1.p1 TRINITY_DN12973_c0_g1~~TRINITY_DN12973_c0_g1_i1.p1  ORF type:complete len:287 (-),score=51.95 TRINITY_DN12973_c0_g1_i1:205-1065(-)
MTSASDWTFCWKLNAPSTSTSNSQSAKSKRKRPAPTNQTVSVNQVGPVKPTPTTNNISLSIMDNIRLPSAETWSGVGTGASVEPKKKSAKMNSSTKFFPTVTPNTKIQIRPVNIGRQQMIKPEERQEADQFIAGMMQRVEIDLFGQEFIQRNPVEYVLNSQEIRRTQSYPVAAVDVKREETWMDYPGLLNKEDLQLLRIKKEMEEDSFNLVATPESGGANSSGDEYSSPALTPVSASDQSFLNFLNDDSLPLEGSDGLLTGCYEVETLPQELFNYDSASWLSCFDP